MTLAMTLATIAYRATTVGDAHLAPADLRRIRVIGDRAVRERPATRPTDAKTKKDS